jgi:hypothetical protein
MQTTAVRRVVLTVAVAALVATAGCSGLGGSDNGDVGYGVSGGDLDGGNLVSATDDAIGEAGSYTIEQQSTATGTQQGTEFTANSTTTTRVDLSAGQGLRESQRSQTTGGVKQAVSSTVYTDGETSYRQQEANGNVTYDTQTGSASGFGGIQPVNVTAFGQDYSQIVDAIAWEQDGTESVDGTTGTVYAATGVANESAFGANEGATVENVDASLLVDSDGVIRELSIAYTIESDGASTTVDVTVAITEIGSTSVSEPGWLSQAQAAA